MGPVSLLCVSTLYGYIHCSMFALRTAGKTQERERKPKSYSEISRYSILFYFIFFVAKFTFLLFSFPTMVILSLYGIGNQEI